MAIERPVSGLVVRNAYHCILIPFPKDHRDVSTRELGEKTAYIKRSGRGIQSSHIVRLEKKKKDKTQHFWPQLQALTSHAPHQAGQVWEARAPNPGALLQLIPVDCCCKEWDQEWSPGHSPTFTLLIMSVPQKLMGSAHFCNLHSLGSDMTCMFLLQ